MYMRKTMKKAELWMIVLVAAAIVVAPAMARAEETAKVEKRQAMTTGENDGDSLGDFAKKIKNPTPWLSWGGDLRLREIFSPNLLLNKEDRHFQRYRLRAWTTIKPIKDIDLNVRLVY